MAKSELVAYTYMDVLDWEHMNPYYNKKGLHFVNQDLMCVF